MKSKIQFRALFGSLLMLLLIFSIQNSVFAQNLIKGKVLEAGTNTPLPTAAVYLDGTFRGTVTNADGEFELRADSYPTTLVVQFLGYKTFKTELKAQPASPLTIMLEVDAFEMEEVVVSGEDPGVIIMREVIKRKQEWIKGLETYKAEGYNRSSLANDTAIAVITETVTELFWDREKGSREIIKSKKQTSNFMESANTGGLRFIPNFYSDKLEIAGFDMFGPTHPDAIANYQFKLVDQSSLDGKVVYKISVQPKKPLQPLFIGNVWVLDEVYAMIKVELEPNDVVRFPPPIKEMTFKFQQQFNNFGTDIWLPLDYRSNGQLKIKMVGLEFPLFRFSENARITGYEINVPLPDSLYEKDEFEAIVDSTTIAQPDSLFFDKVDTIPLTAEEDLAYVKLDSSTSISKAFKPKGFLAKQFDIELEVDGETANSDSLEDANRSFIQKTTDYITPLFRHNRVEGFYGGAKLTIPLGKNLRTIARGGYSERTKEWNYGNRLVYRPQEKSPWRFGAEFNVGLQSRYDALFNTHVQNGLANVLYGLEDYYDWYWQERTQVDVGYRKKDNIFSVALQTEIGDSRQKTNDYDFNGNDRIQRLNPEVFEERINSLKLGFQTGEGPENMQVFGSNGARIDAEFSNEAIGSNYNFARVQGQFNLSIPTFYKRRFVPNKLDIIGFAAVQLGEELPQRQGILETSQYEFTQFGAFRTHIGVPLIGSNLAYLHVEHNFQTVPFEILGLDFLTKRDIGVLVFAGSGVVSGRDFRNLGAQFIQADNRSDTEWIHEVGVSVNKLFGLFRANIGMALPQNEWVFSVSVAKFF